MRIKMFLIFIILGILVSSCAIKSNLPSIVITKNEVTNTSANIEWEYTDGVERLTYAKLINDGKDLYVFEATSNLLITGLNPGEKYYIFFKPKGFNVVIDSIEINTPRSNDSTPPTFESINVTANKAVVTVYDVPSGMKNVKFAIQSVNPIPDTIEGDMEYSYPNTWTFTYSLPYKGEWLWQVVAIDKSLNTALATGVINN